MVARGFRRRVKKAREARCAATDLCVRVLVGRQLRSALATGVGAGSGAAPMDWVS